MGDISNLRRYPPTSNRSLRAVSAADELLLGWAADHVAPGQRVVVAHDRFGALAIGLGRPVTFVAAFHSQEEALRRNGGSAENTTVGPLATLEAVDRALLRVPKSLELFEVYLSQIAAAAGPDTIVAAGFFTRHFTPRLLEIAGRYAAGVEQGRAQKKARLLVLSGFRPVARTQVQCHVLEFAGRGYRQYPGVFSAGRIDLATRFLLEQWETVPELSTLAPGTITDFACGNGIIGAELLLRYPEAKLIATDDSALAVASAQLNLPADRTEVYYDHTLDRVERGSQDLVVTNPPFHFGYETNIEVSLALFRQARGLLRTGAYLVVVANAHLNYATHLRRLFGEVGEVAATDRYVIYRCANG
ncbi:class I SAM-dependent methyltransferase [Lewinella sp. IMCC34183]|uniref:class I SAM-dependent methyltransferase n=1 Tax=Lewinella sp. IMCC34183 TaxID=2248762 RepID=UPI000E234E1A|nr:methyltransferase [Lewinella sp. IMCC34183]